MKKQNNTPGFFIVIEGTDGSGKGTQVSKLVERLASEGYDVALFDFPQYELSSSFFVREYLNGHYGSAQDVGPYTSSLFYALDRYHSARKIQSAIDSGKVVIANRFTGSNMAHQGTKFSNSEHRRGFYIWLDNLEFQMLAIPRPNMNIVLRVPANIAQSLVDQKGKREYTDKKRDIHEADIKHMEKSVEVYDELCQLFPKDFQRIDCVRNGKLLDIETIHGLLWQAIQPELPQKPKTKKGTIQTRTPANPFVSKTDNGYEITEEGEQFLAGAVTGTTDNVYAFKDKLSPTTVAAAMARLSRRGDDMRVTILDEFAMAAGKDEKLLQRVITAYGDDSVQQLVGTHAVVEGASNLLTKKLEWGRLAAYLEQSTRYIYYDQKDSSGNYKYYTPGHLPEDIVAQYKIAMDQIFDLYSSMVRKVAQYVRSKSSVPIKERDIAWKGATRAQACDAVRPVLPVATKSTVGIYGSGQAIESLIMHLLSDELPEARDTGEKLLKHCREIIPTFLERADKPDRGGAIVAYRSSTYSEMKQTAKKYLPDNYSSHNENVLLTDYWPKNELELIPDMLYEHSSLALDEIRQAVKDWPISKKQAVMKTYFGERLNRRHKPGRALEKAHYSWDLVCDYGIFRDLQRHRMVDDLEWQQLSPRLGYDIPELIEEANVSEDYEKCFDLSLGLYSLLQKEGYGIEAQYATLLGHKMRWKVTYNAREAFHLHELRTSPQGHPGYRKLVRQMHEKLTEVHPMVGSAMKFVNQGEDPELTRLAAERYTQFKLSQMKDS